VAKPIIPIYKEQHPVTGEWTFGLTPEDHARVEAGYACHRCLEPFEFWVPVCPVCREPQLHKTGLQIVKTPEGW
jgi:hypothetical protein